VITAVGAPTLDGKKIDFADIDLSAARFSSKGRSISPAEKVKKARTRILFRRFQEGRLPEMDVAHLLGLLDLYDHTDPKEVRREFRHLRDSANALHDEEFVQFIDAVADKFRTYLRRDLGERG